MLPGNGHSAPDESSAMAVNPRCISHRAVRLNFAKLDLPLPMLISKIVRQAASVIAFCISWLDFTLGERPGDIPRGYYHYPAIHGDTIIFTSEGDLWSVSVQGGSGAQCRRVVDFRECCHRISNRLGLGSQKRSRSTDSDRLCHSAAQA